LLPHHPAGRPIKRLQPQLLHSVSAPVTRAGGRSVTAKSGRPPVQAVSLDDEIAIVDPVRPAKQAACLFPRHRC
jgi:hypothetical protein